ncbi:pyridoxal phosphate-dependent decarboxylase family protein [Alkaliphilus hydrothermalis]|uniref:Glutamate/tyrosine decarboxylase-like PLP-dependent enzyme n=1 Tax=Alkaliphilus hydrothermalis TaxID=1482730 RepID=A0ABS2NSB9_9FIRM|nr:aminotransferase class V-fold PLP-dependent enzyme [Alkaliphilus hydrothermalis]MBM7615855.1 glutamate/tyrosine decarboxylase-like PLP-dependent enzyme [Alkaliphilus hydrothermalis]
MKDYFTSEIMDQIRSQTINDTLDKAKQYAWEYISSIGDRHVYPHEEDIANLKVFDEELNHKPQKPDEILEMLHRYGTPATVAQTGGRYFGFVCGAIMPSSLPSKWLADAWDQNPAMFVLSPIASKIESVVEKWIVDILRLPNKCSVGYVSGSSTASFVGICTGRNHLLLNKGYDSIKHGLTNAPQIKVVLGADAHSTIYKALAMAGLGSENVIKVPVDNQGRMIASEMPELDDLTLVIAQAGHVSSGAFDPFNEICKKAQEANAWVHVDGAFGLWARSDNRFDELTKGLDLADSWSVDGHKTLNAPYDNGIIICKHSQSLIDSMQMTGSYIITSKDRDGMMFTPEMSRRARAIDLWSTLKGLGQQGVADMIYEMHSKAVYFADELNKLGLQILNDICFNQVIARYDTDEKTNALIEAIQQSGVLWLGGAKWKGQDIIRISVCSFRTTYEDIDLCIKEIAKLMGEL